jgi:hypothetical protein
MPGDGAAGNPVGAGEGESHAPAEQPPASVASKMLAKDDIRTGMNLAQTAYAVLMTLGLKVAAEALYPAIFAPGGPGGGAFSPVVLSLVFVCILFLAIRFFWVPRNLYGYVHYHMQTRDKEAMRTTFRSLMLLHFPIAFLHTLLFFGICEAFAEMAKTADGSRAPGIHFVCFVIALLSVNAAWLRFGMPSGDGGSGRMIWARNNMAFAVLAGVVLAGFYIVNFSTLALIVASVSLFIANSLVDLASAAENYILFD